MKTPMFLPPRYLHNKKENTTMDFASTQYARDFFQGQVPTIIRTLKQIAANQETQIELQQQVLQAIKTPQRVFVCREENSTALYNDAGNINHLFVTANLGEAISWAQTALCIAKKATSIPMHRKMRVIFTQKSLTLREAPYGYIRTKMMMLRRTTVSALMSLT